MCNTSVVTEDINNLEFLFNCRTQQRIGFIPAAIAPILQVIINLYVLIAVFRSRDKLFRQNYAYLGVASTTLANVLGGCVMAYNFMEQYIGIENALYFNKSLDAKENNHTAGIYTICNMERYNKYMGTWWAFRKGLAICMLITSCVGLGVLTVAIRDNVNIFIAMRKITRTSTKSLNIKKKRKTLAVGVVISWAVPTVLLIGITFGGWNCVQHCRCPPGDYNKIFCPRIKGCHRVWDPMKNSFMTFTVVIWVFVSASLVCLLINTINREKELINKMLFPRDHITHTHAKTELPVSLGHFQVVHEEKKVKKCAPPLSNKLKFLIYLTVLYIVTTAPAVTTCFIDVISEKYILNGPINIASGGCLYIYGIFSPILLIRFLPGFKTAIDYFCFRVQHPTSTTSYFNKPQY